MYSHPLSCRTPLHAAAFSGHVDCVKLLLSHDAPVDVADESGCTPLMMAAARGRVGVVGMKMSHGFNCIEFVLFPLVSNVSAPVLAWVLSSYWRFQSYC